MKTIDTLSPEELRDLARDLQSKVDRFIVIRQQLIDTGGQLDRELGRFKVMQACYKRLLQAESFEEFTSTLLESILEAFEFEGAAFLRLNPDTGRMDVVDQVGLISGPSSATSLERGNVTSSVTQAKPDRKMLISGIVGGIAILIAGLAFLPGLLRGPKPAESAPQGAFGTPETTAPSQAPSSTPAADKVEVRIAVDPSSAILYLDGAQLPGNPYTGRMDNDTKPHRIRATATGYQTREVETTWAQSPNVSLTLEPVAHKGPVGPFVPPKSTGARTGATSTVAPPKIRDER